MRRNTLLFVLGLLLMAFAIYNMFQPLTVTVTIKVGEEIKQESVQVTPWDILMGHSYSVEGEQPQQVQLSEDAKTAIITYVAAPFVAGLVFTFSAFGLGAGVRRR